MIIKGFITKQEDIDVLLIYLTICIAWKSVGHFTKPLATLQQGGYCD